MEFYADKAFQLVQEAQRTKDLELPTYRSDLIRESLSELRSLKSGKGTTRIINDSVINRTKRCILAYQRSRLDRITKMWYIKLTRWDEGACTSTVINADGMSEKEIEFLNNYKAIVTKYKGEMLDIDLGLHLLPPKHLYVEIRVLQDCGERMTENGPVKLPLGTQHYLKRCDVEDLLYAGKVQQI